MNNPPSTNKVQVLKTLILPYLTGTFQMVESSGLRDVWSRWSRHTSANLHHKGGRTHAQRCCSIDDCHGYFCENNSVTELSECATPSVPVHVGFAFYTVGFESPACGSGLLPSAPSVADIFSDPFFLFFSLPRVILLFVTLAVPLISFAELWTESLTIFWSIKEQSLI